MAPGLTEEPPDWFEVTDDDEDAPDGAVLFVEGYQAVYERVGSAWCRRDDGSSYSRPGQYYVMSGDGHEVLVDVPRCTSRKYEHGKVKCRCTKIAGHPRHSMLDGGHTNLGAGRR